MSVWTDRDLGCWARRDDAPPWSGGEERGMLRDWLWACGEPPACDLGLCAHHRRQIEALPDQLAGRVDPTQVGRVT